MNRVVIPDAPVVDRFTVDAGASEVRGEPFSITLSRPARAQATVLARDLADFLEVKAPGGLKGFRVEISGGVILITATVKVIFDIPVKASCRLEVMREKELHVRLESVDVAGGGAKALVESQIEKQNPILNAGDLPFPLRITRVDHEGGQITIHGEAQKLF
jgi:hypothetical protein